MGYSEQITIRGLLTLFLQLLHHGVAPHINQHKHHQAQEEHKHHQAQEEQATGLEEEHLPLEAHLPLEDHLRVHRQAFAQ